MTGLSASMASVTNQAQLSQRDICPATQGSGPPLHAGEWLITYEVFRDLGIAFAAVLVPVLPDTAIIAGAGIMVRNPIILVDFIELRLAEGNGARRCRNRRPRLTLPSDDADSGGGGCRLIHHSVRSHIPGAGHCSDGGRDSLPACFANDRTCAVL